MFSFYSKRIKILWHYSLLL